VILCFERARETAWTVSEWISLPTFLPRCKEQNVSWRVIKSIEKTN
jgi:hypothetical protein